MIGNHTEGRPSVLIDAHIDEIGMICTYIDDEGFIVPGNVGGMDYRILPAMRVTVHGKKDISGVVAAVPPHLSSGTEVHKNMDNIRIDTGLDVDELRQLVPPGSTISFDTAFRPLLGSRVTGKALDNRICAAALIRFASLVKDEDLPCNVTLLFSTAEEIGHRGAVTACFECRPDIALAVDTSFAVAPGEDPKKCGIMGKGVMIGISPVLSREISSMLMDIASENGISFQTEVMCGMTGTNADSFSVTGKGAKTCTCSIPVRSMHTPAETADISDIESTALLLAEFVRRIK
jgi:endoglucanase